MSTEQMATDGAAEPHCFEVKRYVQTTRDKCPNHQMYECTKVHEAATFAPILPDNREVRTNRQMYIGTFIRRVCPFCLFSDTNGCTCAGMYVIAVLSLKGGVGKTTLATNLAAAAHLRGKSTILVDLDKQGSALDWGSMRAENSKLAGIAVSKHDRNFSRARLLELAVGREVVVLDGPPRIGDQSGAAAIAADIVVIPVTPGPFDLWATDETLQELDRADALREQLGRGPVRRLFVANRCASRTVLTRSAREALGQRGQVSETTIQQRVAYPESAAVGESVLTTQPKGPASAELQKLFDEIMPIPVEPVVVATTKKKRGKA